MSSPSSLALQRLHRLDRSSSDFHDQLCDALYGREYVQCEQTLQDDDLVWLIDYLDEALDSLDPSSPASRKCLRELRSICGTRTTLPTSYFLPRHLLQIDPDPFTFGGFGDVYRGTLRGSKVCVKRVRVYTQNGTQNPVKTFCQEAVIWKRLTHPNVLPLLGVTITPLQLISNWISGGNLPEYIQKHPDADLLGLLSGVAEGLRYLHLCNVIHGDLKGANILVETSGRVCIADFGLAKITQNPDSIRNASSQNGYTMRWAPPEVLNKGEYSKETDIFSFAMVMIEVFTGRAPFSDRTPVMAMLLMTQGERPPRPTHPTFTEELWTLTQRCWYHDPHLRPEVSEVLQVLLTVNPPAWKRLISDPLSMDEYTVLITSIFSNRDEVEVVGYLSGDDAQTFVNIIDEVFDGLTPEIQRRCLHCLSRIFSRQILVPRSPLIPLCHNPMQTPLYAGEFAGVWKGQHNGWEVATKAPMVPASDLEKARKWFCKEIVIWRTLHHPNVLPLLGVTITENQLAAVSEWMGNGDINEFLKAHPDANRLELLTDITEGLIYMHNQGIAHGNLNGSNILIDHNGRACLAGFSLLTIIPDGLVITSSDLPGGRAHWMGGVRWSAPEVLNGGTPSRKTDIFSLAMIMVEIFTGTIPFSDCPSSGAILTITQGRRPPRPKHPSVTGGLWRLMQCCWDENPCSRPEASDILPILLNFNPPAWKRLISPALFMDERIDLIQSIFSDHDEAEAFKYLSGNDAQMFVDVVAEALESLDSLPPETHKCFLHTLYGICGDEALLPRSLLIPLHNDPMGVPHYSGGFADVWKAKHNGQNVAVKVFKAYTMGDPERVRKRFCKEAMTWKTLHHPNVLPLLGVAVTWNQFALVSEWMENGNINVFVKAHPGVNQLELLADVTKGLIYMHDQEIAHGYLKGSNILIDRTGHAVLADFTLTTLASDQPVFPSDIGGGTVQWTSPELLDPKSFGLLEGRPTRQSDYYALGMVIYEVLSGQRPFGNTTPIALVGEIMQGKRPKRPQGEEGKPFTDDIWDMMQLCWKAEPSGRASAKDVLLCFEAMEGEGDQSDAVSTDSEYFSDELDSTEGNLGSPVAPKKSGLLIPSLDSPPSVPSSPVIPQDGDQFLDPPQANNPDEGWIDGWLAPIFWNIFNAVISQIHVIQQVRQ